MTKQAKQSMLVRVFRTSAHLAIAAMWFMALAAYLPSLLELSVFDANTGTKTPPSAEAAAPIAIPNSAVIVATIGGLLILWLVFIVIKRFYIPATNNAVEHMTETAQKRILVTLEKREPQLPKKEKQQISRYTVEATYLLLVAAPLLTLFIDKPIQTETIRLITEFTLSVLALYAVLVISISQYAASRSGNKG